MTQLEAEILEHKTIMENNIQAKPMVYDKNLPNCIIVDLDGTVCIMNGRTAYGPSYECLNDLPNEAVIGIIIDYHQRFISNRVFILSGRNINSINETVDWLDNYGVPYDEVWLNTWDEKNKVSDLEFKKIMYESDIKGKYNVEFVLDDRDKVVKMWRELGLNCLQVAEGDF